MTRSNKLLPDLRILRSFALGSLTLAGISGCATQTCIDGVSGVSSIPGAEIFTPLVAVACIGAAQEVYIAASTTGAVVKAIPQVEETEEDRTERLAALERRANRDAESAAELARETGNLSYLEKLTSEGDSDAISEWVSITGTVSGAAALARTSGNVTYLEDLAKAGNPEAALEFAKVTGNPKYLEPDASFALYKDLSYERQTFKQAWSLLCKAANSGHGEAQQEVAMWHRESMWSSTNSEQLEWLRDDIRVSPDNRLAYMWYTFAGRQQAYANALWLRNLVEEDMTSKETYEAEQMVRDWQPGDCPSAENRLAPPGES